MSDRLRSLLRTLEVTDMQDFSPLMLVAEGFLTEEECASVIKAVRGDLGRPMMAGHGADPSPPPGTDPRNRGKRLGFVVELFLPRTKIPRLVIL